MKRLLLFYVLLGLLVAGCNLTNEQDPRQKKVLRMAVTTSTRDSGLLDELCPLFEKEHNVTIQVIAKGTGAAIHEGERGNVDLILVHARTAEDQFMADQHGIRREDVMFNTFEILGPKNDPAGVKGMEVIAAMKKIAASKHPFVSRGDDSGTHQRELSLWKLALWKQAGGLTPWEVYLEVGQGMGATLIIANQKNSYVLSDHGTYLKFKKKIELVPLVTGSKELLNPYGIIVVNPNKHQNLNGELANKFVDFMISEKIQKLIQSYKVDGEQLFFPMRLKDQKESVR